MYMYEINNNVHVYSLKMSIDKYMYMYYNITMPHERGMVMKESLLKLVDEMNENEIAYVCTLLSKLFGREVITNE